MPKASPIPVFLVGGDNSWMPLSLGMIQAYAVHGTPALGAAFRFIDIPKNFIPLIPGFARSTGAGIWMFSNYLWNSDIHLELSAMVKKMSPRAITIHGGPNVPKYEEAGRDFLRRHPHIDIAVRGEGELTAAALLEHFAGAWGKRGKAWKRGLEELEGISFCADERGEHVIRTPDRPRVNDVNLFPSPYLNGIFDSYAALGAIHETNRGCPYRCTFCDWGSLTQQKVQQFDLERVRAEIDWTARRQVPTIFIADANFGLFERDVEIAEHYVRAKERYGYPREIIVSYAKNATLRLAEIIRIWAGAGLTGQGIIAIQTSDEETLKTIGRSNIKTSKYDELAAAFRELNLPLSTDLMIGLPGATVASFKGDLQRYFDRDIPVKAYQTQLLPNSPMANPDYIREHRIETDDGNMLVTTFSYTREEYRKMLDIYALYVLLEKYGFLRYVLRFLQWEHGIGALDLLEALLDNRKAAPSLDTLLEAGEDRLRLLEWSSSGGLERFYDELADFIQLRFGIPAGEPLRTVCSFNRAVMPDSTQSYPLTLELAHDALSYFLDHFHRPAGAAIRPFGSYPPGRVIVEDPEQLSAAREFHHQANTHQIFWELYTPVRKAQSNSFFLSHAPES